MKRFQKVGCSLALGLAGIVGAGAASADIIKANCTGMFDLEDYEFDTTLDTQEIDGIGLAEVSIDEEAIHLEGDFGTYRFDRKAGTMYHNDSDTGLYCTYRTEEE